MHTHRIRRGLFWLFLGLLSLPVLLQSAPPAWAGPPLAYPTIGKIERLDPAMDKLIPKDAVIEVLASGFEWCEGPLWMKDLSYLDATNAPNAPNPPWIVKEGDLRREKKPDGFLLFSDTRRNCVLRWQKGEDISVFMRPSGYTGVTPYSSEPGSNGLALDAQGRISFCEHGDRRVSRLEKGGGKRTLVDNYQGKRLNSPNDLIYHSSGDLYFSDPPYGLPLRYDDPLRELDFCGVYRLKPDGQLTLLTKDQTAPNGVALSPDEKTLYVANSDPEKAIWMAYELRADGTLGKARQLFDATPLVVEKRPGLPDGLKTDKTGHIFASGPGGIHIFTPAGKRLGTLNIGEAISNCGWGNDGSVLYITADAYLCRIQTSTKGAGW
ncbi:MAG TPA: SMP-30/gluconolactonase/LRE family protein [Pirellulales bacterium]|jgi:gluconolactonase